MQPTRDALLRALNRPPRRVDYAGARQASVAALFTPELDLVLIRRADRAGDPWSGHVSLPGGRMEAVDASPLHAAVRETHEEIGVALPPEHLLGELDELPTMSPLPPLVVRSFVFILSERPTFRPNHEVAQTHLLGLDALLRGEGRGEMSLQWGEHTYQMPCVDFDGVRLWGLTLHVIDDLLHRIDGRGMGLERPKV